jgi:hypothetical protein
MSDKEELQQLVSRHTQLTDDGEYEQRLGLYVTDCTFTLADGTTLSGYDELRKSFAAAAGRRGGKHYTASSVYTVDGDRATGSSDYLYLRKTGDGFVPAAAGRYNDEYVREGGTWLFKSRMIAPY